ncbi:MAG: YkgJ family cysteine cluster protein [Pirellulaceae bacterium]
MNAVFTPLAKRIDMPADDSSPWYREGLAFECTQCGRCCGGAPGFVWVEPEEIAAMAEAVGMGQDIEQFERRFVRSVGARKSLVEYPDGDCIFLDPQTRGCTVYQARPIQCRTWPFWTSNLEDPKAWQQTARHCPGCNQGPVYTLQEIEQRRRQREER